MADGGSRQSLNEAGYYSYDRDGAASKFTSTGIESGYQAARSSLLATSFPFCAAKLCGRGDLLWLDEATATYFEGKRLVKHRKLLSL